MLAFPLGFAFGFRSVGGWFLSWGLRRMRGLKSICRCLTIGPVCGLTNHILSLIGHTHSLETAKDTHTIDLTKLGTLYDRMKKILPVRHKLNEALLVDVQQRWDSAANWQLHSKGRSGRNLVQLRP